jgi:hypothetical protein
MKLKKIAFLSAASHGKNIWIDLRDFQEEKSTLHPRHCRSQKILFTQMSEPVL